MKNAFEDILAKENITFNDLFFNKAFEEGSTAIHYRDQQVSYASLRDMILRTATLLRRRGLKRGEIVTLVIQDTPAFPALFFGIMAAGGTVIPINPLSNAEDIEYMLRLARPSMVFVSPDYAPKIENLQRGGEVDTVFRVGDLLGLDEDYDRELSDIQIEPEMADNPFNEVAYGLFSSGTTGRPKAIMHSFRDLVHCARSYSADVLSLDSDDVVMAVPKHAFGYALGGNLVFGFLSKAASVLFSEASTASLVAANVARYGVTVLLAQPRILNEIMSASDDLQNMCKHLRLVASAGEPLASSLLSRWNDYCDIPLLDGFGSTEVGHIFISNRTGDVAPGSNGNALAGYELKIVDSQGNELPDGTIGRLCIRGASLFKGYLNNEEATRKAYSDDWFVSGDLFKRSNGYLYCEGRYDDMIKTGCGEWVSPHEIENVALANDRLLECVAIGDRDENGVIILKLIAVPNNSSEDLDGLEGELIARSVKEWPELTHKHIKRVDFVPALPRNATGKIMRHKLKAVSLNEFSYDC